MNPLIQLKTTILPLLIALALACLGLAPSAKATDTDGALPSGNNADGVGVLVNLMPGGNWNSGFGFEALNHDTIGSLNTATGLRALFNNTEGDANTANGMMALFSNTTGFGNVAIGAQALVFNIDGGFNTAVGTQALSSNTGGQANTATGIFALFHNIDGSDNNAFGRSTLVENIHAHGNTAIGSSALASNDVTGNGTANFNTAIGAGALVSNTDGELNTAVGFVALSGNTVGHSNQAMGAHALANNENGVENVAIGLEAMNSNVGGLGNVAIGHRALFTSVSGILNTVVGWEAGHDVEGIDNIYIGDSAGAGVVAEDFTIRIGNLAFVVDCYIAGIYGSTYGQADMAVRIGNDGKLGTVVSSRRFKHDIKPMDKASEAILALKPVTFHYNSDAENRPAFGLIAEEVAEVSPDLVVPDKEGKPLSVRYEDMNVMLLNEFLKEHRIVQEQGATIAHQQKQIEALTAGLQKVSAQLEASKPAPQLVNNP